MQTTASLFDRWIARPKHRRMSLIVAVVCSAAPFVAAGLEGTLPWLAEGGRWRGILVPPTIIA